MRRKSTALIRKFRRRMQDDRSPENFSEDAIENSEKIEDAIAAGGKIAMPDRRRRRKSPTSPPSSHRRIAE